MRRLLIEIQNEANIVIFIKKEHEEIVKNRIPEGIEYRIIDERKNTLTNSYLEKVFLLCRKLPITRNNFFLMEAFKIGNLQNKKERKRAQFLLNLQKRMPHFFSYDSFLERLQTKNKTQIDDIDTFICLTEIYDNYLFARLLKEKNKTFVYVYSWDHSCKHTRFSKHVEYLVWNDEIKNDLIQIQHIIPEKIQVWGSTQLAFIHDFRESKVENVFSSPYYYYACGIGIADLIQGELHLIEQLSAKLFSIDKVAKLVVRPYPNIENWDIYNDLLKNPNIILDNDFKQEDFSVSESDIMKKFVSINEAKAFFHPGTTLGLEACFTNCPSFILNIEPRNEQSVTVYNFVNQYQNQKYLIHQSDNNTIQNLQQLDEIIPNLSHPKYHELSDTIRKQFPVASFGELSKKLLQLIQ